MSDGNYQQQQQQNLYRLKANYFRAIKMIRGFMRIHVIIQCRQISSVFGNADYFSGSDTIVLQRCRTLPSDAQMF